MSSDHDLMRRIASATARMDLGLSHRDIERLVAGARRSRQRRRVWRATATAGAACAVVLALGVAVYRRPVLAHTELGTTPKSQLTAQPHESALPAGKPILHLKDGSTAAALDPFTEIAIAEDKTDRVDLVLKRGRGSFDVKPQPRRDFVVHVGRVTVAALGTLFVVERVADRVGVSVESGTVRVDWGVGSTLLEENESGWYPPLVISRGSDPTTEEPAPVPTSSPSLASAHVSASSPVATKTGSAADLLVAADDARMAGSAEQAAELLRRLLREHRNDARAPLAAFTLGRMLLMELARPLEAAAAFAEARRLSPGGSLAEDAMAREVEALSRAGATARANARAKEYLHLYPQGRRAANVRMMGGIK